MLQFEEIGKHLARVQQTQTIQKIVTLRCSREVLFATATLFNASGAWPQAITALEVPTEENLKTIRKEILIVSMFPYEIRTFSSEGFVSLASGGLENVSRSTAYLKVTLLYSCIHHFDTIFDGIVDLCKSACNSGYSSSSSKGETCSGALIFSFHGVPCHCHLLLCLSQCLRPFSSIRERQKAQTIATSGKHGFIYPMQCNEYEIWGPPGCHSSGYSDYFCNTVRHNTY